MTTSQIKIINQYGLTYEAEINGIVYYTSQKEDGYYFVDSTGQGGIFDNKENFYGWAKMRELLRIPAIKL